MNISLVKARIPKGYRKLEMYFDTEISAKNYAMNLKKNYLLKQSQLLEHPGISKRKKKLSRHSKLKYVMTKVGSKYCLWEKLS